MTQKPYSSTLIEDTVCKGFSVIFGKIVYLAQIKIKSHF